MLNFGFKRSSLSVPSVEDLIAAYTGKVSSDGSKLLAKSGNHDTAQVVPTSIAFGGAGIGTLVEPGTDTATSVVLPSTDWDEPITGSFILTDTNFSCVLGGETRGVDEFLIQFDDLGNLSVASYIGSVSNVMTSSNSYRDGNAHIFEITYIGGLATLTVDGTDSVSSQFDLDGNQNIAFVGQRSNGGNKYIGNIWDLKGPGFDLAMTAGSGTVERSSTPGLPDCVFSGFTNMDAIYAEHYDGVVGSNRANEDGFGIDVSGNRVPVNHVTAVTNYPGPIAADWTARRVALQGDGALSVELDEAITLSGDFRIVGKAQFTVDGTYRGLLGGASSSEGILRISVSGAMQVYFGGIAKNFTTVVPVDGVLYDWELKRVGTTVTLTVGDMSESSTITLSDFVIRTFAAYTYNKWLGTYHYLKIYNADDTLIHHWHMEDGVPYSSGIVKVEDIVGGNHGTVVDATSEADIWTYVDGPSRRLLGYNKNENLLKYSEDLTQSVWVTAGGAIIVSAKEFSFEAASNIDNTTLVSTVLTGTSVTFSVKGLVGVGSIVLRIQEIGGTWDLTTSAIIVLSDTPQEANVTRMISGGTGLRLLVANVDDIQSVAGSFDSSIVIEGTADDLPDDYVTTTSQPITGYQLASHADNTKDIHGIDLEYKQGQWQTALQSKIEFKPPLNKYSCYNHGQNPILFNDQPALSYSQNTAIGDKAMVDYFDDDPILGPELTTDGDFSTGVSWATGSGWEISGGKANSVSGTSGTMTQAMLFNALETGDVVSVQFSVSGRTVGTCFFNQTGGPNGVSRTTNDTFFETMIIDAATTGIGIYGDVTFDGSVDNLSVRKYDDTQTGVIADIIPAVDKYAGILGEELFSADLTDGTGITVTGEDETHIVTFSESGLRYQSDTASPVLSVILEGLPLIEDEQYAVLFSGAVTSGAIKSDQFAGNNIEIGTPQVLTSSGTTGLFGFYRSTVDVDMLITSISVKQITRETT